MWKTRLFCFAASAFILPVCAVFGQIRDIKEIKNLSPEKAAEGLPVEIEAQVTHLHPRRRAIFLYDGEQGVYCNLPNQAQLFKHLKPGANVRIKGITHEGGFVPAMTAQELEVVGWKPLPQPRQFHAYEVFVPSIRTDCEWVNPSGRLVGAAAFPEQDYIMLELEILDTRVGVQVPYAENAMEKAASLMFRRISFPAVVGTIYNRNRQMTGRVLFVNSMEDIEAISDGGEWDNLELWPIHTLMRSGGNYQKAVRTHGVVTFAGEQAVFLRGEQAALKVATIGGTELIPGDFVEVKGFIWPQPISPAFRARSTEVIEHREAPEPMRVNLAGNLDSRWNYDLISADVELVDIGRSFGLTPTSLDLKAGQPDTELLSLLCRAGDRLFEAKLPTGSKLDSRFSPGAIIRLSGLCNIIPNRDPRWVFFTETLWIQLRDVSDVSLLVPAPWWTAGRLVWVIGIVSAATLLFLIWVVMLRKTVNRQTGVIVKQIERETVLNERQRIARELHDTLEQGLAGMALQLKSCAKQFDGNLEKGKASLKLAEGMLRHCREESRTSILELRGGLLEKMDMASAFREAVRPLADECGAKFTVKVKGKPRRLQQYAERHLFRIVKEAATNAVRHAKPKTLSIDLQFSPTQLEISVCDDGAGFDVSKIARSERFGLQGMLERANRLHGKVDLDSTPGKGTCVKISLNTEEWELDQ